jgi:hypothetical protein
MSELKVGIIIQIVGVLASVVLTSYLPAFYKAIKGFTKSVEDFKKLIIDYPEFKDKVDKEHKLLHSKIDKLNGRVDVIDGDFSTIKKALKVIFFKLKKIKPNENID